MFGVLVHECGGREEIKLPVEGLDHKDWSMQENVHPFWLMRRSEDRDESNAEIVRQDLPYVCTIDCEELKGTGLDDMACCLTFHVMFPYIVNTKEIKSGDEVVLYLPKRPKKKPRDNTGTKPGKNAFDLLRERAAKRLKQK